MKEILTWGNPYVEFEKIGIKPKCTWIGLGRSPNEMRIYEVDDDDFKVLLEDPETDDNWQKCYWRSAEGSNMGSVNSRFKIAKHYIKAWDGQGRIEALEEVNYNTNHDEYFYQNREYFDLLEYFSEEVGASQPGNVCALAMDLAQQNNMKMSELFSKFQPL